MSERPMTLHVVQSFVEVDAFTVANEPIACQSAAQAREKARLMKSTKACVIAWSRTFSNPDLGEWGAPKVLVRYGVIPDEFEE